MNSEYWLGIVEGWILAQPNKPPAKIREALAKLAGDNALDELRDKPELIRVRYVPPEPDEEITPEKEAANREAVAALRRGREAAAVPDEAEPIQTKPQRRHTTPANTAPAKSGRTRSTPEQTAANIDKLRATDGRKTLAEMAPLIGKSEGATYQMCLAHKIPFARRPKGSGKGSWGYGSMKPKKNEHEEALDAAQTTTFIDEQGRTVTKCPPRWANGVGLGRHTAKPSSG